MRQEFERVAPEAVGIPSQSIELLLDRLESGFTQLHGIMIYRNGKICAEGWRAPYAPGQRHQNASLTKTYAGTAIGIAYTQGLLDLDEKLADIFQDEIPDSPSENLKKLTIRHLLMMRVGSRRQLNDSSDVVHDFFEIPIEDEPGTTFLYNNMASNMLGEIIKRKTGENLHEFLKERLFDKIGIISENLRWETMDDGVDNGAGGLFATTEDNLRLGVLYINGGKWNNEQIIAEDYVNLAMSRQNDTDSWPDKFAADNFCGYGYQMWLCRPEGCVRMDGAGGQYVFMFPRQNMVIAMHEIIQVPEAPHFIMSAVFECILPYLYADTLAENSEKAAALKKRLDTLSLPRPKYRPLSYFAGSIKGNVYKVVDGTVSLRNILGIPGDGRKKEISWDTFSMDFDCNVCRLTIKTDSGETIIQIGMDGNNRLTEIDGPCPNEVYCHGAWISETCFEMGARYIEENEEKILCFSFCENGEVNIEYYTPGLSMMFTAKKTAKAKLLQSWRMDQHPDSSLQYQS